MAASEYLVCGAFIVIFAVVLVPVYAIVRGIQRIAEVLCHD